MQWSDRERGFVVDATGGVQSSASAWVVRAGSAPAPLAGGGAWLGVSSQGGMAWLSGGGVQHVLFQSPAGGAPLALSTASDLSDREPSFSPAGDLVVFVRIPAAGGPSAGIWEVRTDGRELRQLSPDGTQPRWLP